MSVAFTWLDVFAQSPFQGTQIPVIESEHSIPDAVKVNIARELNEEGTVFVETDNTDEPVTVFNREGKTLFGAHTTLAAAFVAHQQGLSHSEGNYSHFQITDSSQSIDCFIDNTNEETGTIQFARTLSPSFDSYTPDPSKIAQALRTEEKHISYSRYKPLLVSVDRPVLMVPFTRAEHILAASLDNNRWHDLVAEIYASDLFLFAPGSVTGLSEFHGRIINPTIAPQDYPPIGKLIPEFVAYLAEQEDTNPGTHTFSIDRGSEATRKSLLQVEFDKRPGKKLQCRIGGQVIKMGSGSLKVSN